MCKHTSKHTYTDVQTLKNTHRCICTLAKYTHTYKHTHKNTLKHTLKHTHKDNIQTHTQTYTQTQKYIHVCTLVNIQTHINIQRTHANIVINKNIQTHTNMGNMHSQTKTEQYFKGKANPGIIVHAINGEKSDE